MQTGKIKSQIVMLTRIRVIEQAGQEMLRLTFCLVGSFARAEVSIR